MRRQTLPVAVILGCALLTNVLRAQDEKGFISMFNGKDLSGWEGEAGWWSVEDGAITGITTAEKPLKRATYLFWRGTTPDHRGGNATDFELRATYRIVGGNSGINFRSRQLPHWDVHGYQADIEAGPTYTGILYEVNQRAVMALRGQKVEFDQNGAKTTTAFADAKELQKAVKADGWNECHVIARGPEILIKVNGVLMSHVIDREQGKAAREGLFCLQLHPGPPMKVQFKDLRVKHLR